MRELRIPIVVLAIDLYTPLGQVLLQVPHIRRVLDLAGHLLCCLRHFAQLPLQSTIEGLAGDCLF